MSCESSRPARRQRESKSIAFEVISVGAPGPVSLLRAQMIALDIAPARIQAAAARLRIELKGEGKSP